MSEDSSVAFEKYVEGAERTMPESMRWDDLLADAALGLCGEAEEVLQMLDGAQSEEAGGAESLDDEIGDAWWYVAAAYRAMTMQMEIEPPRSWSSKGPASDLLRLAARFAERAKKVRYHREPLSDHAKPFLDILEAYGGILDGLTETPTEDVWRWNVEKLAERYPDGFETAQAE